MVRDYKEAWIIFRTEKNPNEFVKKTIEVKKKFGSTTVYKSNRTL